MTELDYAYLADYAQVADGKISALGASFTYVKVQEIGAIFPFSIVGRIRADKDIESLVLGMKISPPNNEYTMEISSMVVPNEMIPYDGKIGILFAANTMIQIVSKGLYTVELSIEGRAVRTLKFEVEA